MGICSLIYIGEENLVCRLVQYACHAKHQDGPAIGKHTTQEGLVEIKWHSGDLFQQEEEQSHRTEQVDVEGVSGIH